MNVKYIIIIISVLFLFTLLVVASVLIDTNWEQENMNVIDEAEDLRIDLKVEINRKNYMSETSFAIDEEVIVGLYGNPDEQGNISKSYDYMKYNLAENLELYLVLDNQNLLLSESWLVDSGITESLLNNIECGMSFNEVKEIDSRSVIQVVDGKMTSYHISSNGAEFTVEYKNDMDEIVYKIQKDVSFIADILNE